MKKLFTLLLLTLIFFSAFSQSRVMIDKKLTNIALSKPVHENLLLESGEVAAPYKTGNLFFTETTLGQTRYDNQSNASIPKKIYKYDDGTIGATWTMSMDEGSFFADRGTGYNYFNGTEWDEWPEQRVENIKVHRPTYAPFGENGELIVSHVSGTGLYFASRETKGTGDWDYADFPGPASNPYILWNRMVTSGPDHSWIHILAMTLPANQGGQLYEGLDGALLYSRSTDGGDTWDVHHEVLDGMESDEYVGFSYDSYAFAEPKDDIVAFVVGDPWVGLFLMKSEDGGENFDKTIIWEHPYPMWQFGTPTDTFYCADGSHSAVIDADGMVHVAFGINRVQADDNGTYWYPFVDGIAYWNEDMPAFSNNLNALSTEDHPDSELIEDYNLIGWTQDVNNNGEIEFLEEIGLYFIGLSSMPQLVIGNNGDMCLAFASVTETYDNGLKNYRKIWMRMKYANEDWGGFTHLTSSLVHIFDECVYPACAPSIEDDYLHLIYQYDVEPGTAVWASQHPYVDNNIAAIVEYIGLTGTNDGKTEDPGFEISQNYPNPVSGKTYVKVKLDVASELNISLTTLTGQLVREIEHMKAGSGETILTIDAGNLSAGVYFYTISDGRHSQMKKLIVE